MPESDSNQKTARRWRFRWRRLKPREVRMLIYLLVLFLVAAWKFIPRPWHPTGILETEQHTIYSTATREQIGDTARALGLLYAAYSNRLSGLPQFERRHPKLKVKLYRDRAELRRINPGLGWVEAFYREPYCHAYFSAEESNPYQWMLHEAVHQLNRQVAHLKLEKWLDEGSAEYFATSRLTSDGLLVGRVDPDTYPVWWIGEIAISADLSEDLRNGSVIPLRTIITNRGGPRMSRNFNLYYVHWWTLTHFVFESPRYRDRSLELVRQGGGIEAFERLIGPVEQVQKEWYEYVQQLKATIARAPLEIPGPPERPERESGE